MPPGWDRWVAFVHSEYFDYGLTVDGTVRRYGVEPEDYSTDVLAAETEDFIRESDGPVFALFAPPAPHDPAIPTGVDEGLFADLPRVAAAIVQRAGRLGQAGARAGHAPARARPDRGPRRAAGATSTGRSRRSTGRSADCCEPSRTPAGSTTRW